MAGNKNTALALTGGALTLTGLAMLVSGLRGSQETPLLDDCYSLEVGYDAFASLGEGAHILRQARKPYVGRRLNNKEISWL